MGDPFEDYSEDGIHKQRQIIFYLKPYTALYQQHFAKLNRPKHRFKKINLQGCFTKDETPEKWILKFEMCIDTPCAIDK